MTFGYNKRRQDPLTLGYLAWVGGLYGKRVHVAEGFFRIVEGVSALAERVAAVTVSEAGEVYMRGSFGRSAEGARTRRCSLHPKYGAPLTR